MNRPLVNNSQADTSLFFYKTADSIVLLLVYVDDILLIGNYQQLLSQLVHDFYKHFALKDLGELNFFFFGI